MHPIHTQHMIMSSDILDCFDHVAQESSLATPAMYVKGLGRGQQRPVDPLTIRLPNFLTDLAIEKTNKLKKKSFTGFHVDGKIKQNLTSGNSKQTLTSSNSKKTSDCRSSFDNNGFFDWHFDKSQNSEKSLFSTPSSSVDEEVDVSSLKDKIEWPSICSVPNNSDNLKMSKKKEMSLNFKSIGQLLYDNNDNDDGLDDEMEDSVADNTVPEETFKLCIQNIPFTLSEEDLTGALSPYGVVNDCQIFRGTDSHSMAVVTTDSHKACEWMISCLHGEESPFPGYADGEIPELAVFQIKTK